MLRENPNHIGGRQGRHRWDHAESEEEEDEDEESDEERDDVEALISGMADTAIA